MRPTTSTRLLLLCLLIAVAALWLGSSTGEAHPGGPDDGLLHLAGATSLIRDGDYPIVQRPPLYSLLLAALARTQTIDLNRTTPAAQELGSITTFDVAEDLLQSDYLRLVLWAQIVLWLATLLLMIFVLRSLNIGWRGVYLAVLLALVPSSWRMTGLVSETILCQFLLMIGILALLKALTGARRWIIPAGIAFALLAFAKPTFQLLSPVLLILIALILLWQERRDWRRVLPLTAGLLLPWLIIVGGWSLQNQARHGFLGMSGVGGVALSTRTALYLERAAPTYPDEAAIFADIRNQLFIDTADKNDVVYWGARASNWLMSTRGMSYLDANRFLTAFNLRAIAAAPLNYLDTVLTSLISFHFPGVTDSGGTLPRLVWSAIEFALIAAFTALTLLWLAYRFFAWRGLLAHPWQTTDTLIALLLTMFWYTALISSAIDVGKPEHRLPVQIIIPLTIMLVQQRLEKNLG